MEYIEIILNNVQTRFLKEIITEQLQFMGSDVRASHFFSPKTERTITYSEINNWDMFFEEKGTGDISLKEVVLGMSIKNVVVLITYRPFCNDISISFGEDQLSFECVYEAQENIRKLFQKLIDISQKCGIDDITIGYEPAEDEDMKILEIHHGKLRFYNEDSFCSPEILIFRQVGREMLG